MGLNDFKFNQEVKTVDASKKVRIGIIGCGWIAKSHIRSYLKQPDVEIVAGCDLIEGKAAKFFQTHGVENVKTLSDEPVLPRGRIIGEWRSKNTICFPSDSVTSSFLNALTDV